MKLERFVVIPILFAFFVSGIGDVKLARADEPPATYIEPLGPLVPGNTTPVAVLGEPWGTAKLTLGFPGNPACWLYLPDPWNIPFPLCFDSLFSLILQNGGAGILTPSKIVQFDDSGHAIFNPSITIPLVRELVGVQVQLGMLNLEPWVFPYTVATAPITLEPPSSFSGEGIPTDAVLCGANPPNGSSYAPAYRPLGLQGVSQFNLLLGWDSTRCAPAAGASVLAYLARRDQNPNLIRPARVRAFGRTSRAIATTTVTTDVLAQLTQAGKNGSGGTDVARFMKGFIDYLINSGTEARTRYKLDLSLLGFPSSSSREYRQVLYAIRFVYQRTDLVNDMIAAIESGDPALLFVTTSVPPWPSSFHAIALEDFIPTARPNGRHGMRVMDPARARIEFAEFDPADGTIYFGPDAAYVLRHLLVVKQR